MDNAAPVQRGCQDVPFLLRRLAAGMRAATPDFGRWPPVRGGSGIPNDLPVCIAIACPAYSSGNRTVRPSRAERAAARETSNAARPSAPVMAGGWSDRIRATQSSSSIR